MVLLFDLVRFRATEIQNFTSGLSVPSSSVLLPVHPTNSILHVTICANSLTHQEICMAGVFELGR